MSVPIKEDSHEKADLRGKKAFSACNYIHNKLHLHVCAWWLSSTRLNNSETYLNYKLDCEDTDAGKVLTHISNTNAISLSSDKFQAWIVSILMNEPPQTMQSN